MKDYIALNRLTPGQNIPRPPFGDVAIVYDSDGSLKLVDGDTVSRIGLVPEPPANSGMVNRSNGKWVKPVGTPTVVTIEGDPSFLRLYVGDIPVATRPLEGQLNPGGTRFGKVIVGSSTERIELAGLLTLPSTAVKFRQAIISEGVKFIGESAFAFNEITSVVIPSTVKEIGNFAFQNNILTSLTLSEGLEKIGSTAFSGGDLTNLVLPSTIKLIGSYAFSGNNLYSLVIPGSLAEIEYETFSNNNLISLTLSEGVTSINGSAFENNSLTSLVIPGSVKGVFASAFRNNNLTSLTLSEGLEVIGQRAFESNNLTSVVIPSSVTSIGDNAFNSNNLTSVSLPYGLKTIGAQAFVGNPLLSDIYCLAEKSVLLTSTGFGFHYFAGFVFPGSGLESFSYPSFGPTGATGVQRIHVAVNDDTWTAGPLTMSGGNTILVIKDLPPIPLPRPVEVPSGSGSSGSGVGVGLI